MNVLCAYMLACAIISQLQQRQRSGLPQRIRSDARRRAGLQLQAEKLAHSFKLLAWARNMA